MKASDITVRVNGSWEDMPEDIKDEFYQRLAEMMVKQFGIENCEKLIEVL